MNLQMISIKVIIPNPEQPRKSFRKIEELADNIKENGLINPISVQPKKDGSYLIISGERRWKACKEYLNWRNIPAIVKQATPYEMLAENLARDDMSLLEKIEAVSKVLEHKFGKDYAKILGRVHNGFDGPEEKKIIKACKAMGITATYAYLSLSILKLSNAVKKTILNNRDYFTDGVVLKLASIKDDKLTSIISKSIVREKMTSKESFRSIRQEYFAYKDLDENTIEWENWIEKWGKTSYTVLKLIKELGSKEKLRNAPIKFRKKIRSKLSEFEVAISEVLY